MLDPTSRLFHVQVPQLHTLTAMESPDIQAKYQKLAAEYSKVGEIRVLVYFLACV